MIFTVSPFLETHSFSLFLSISPSPSLSLSLSNLGLFCRGVDGATMSRVVCPRRTQVSAPHSLTSKLSAQES